MKKGNNSDNKQTNSFPETNNTNTSSNANISNINSHINPHMNYFIPQTQNNPPYIPQPNHPQRTEFSGSIPLNEANFHSDDESDFFPLTINEPENPYEMPESLQSNADIKNARKYVWWEYLNQLKMDSTRTKEVKDCIMEFGEVTMKYGVHIIGAPLKSGYPLFIALHGGGGSDTPDLNNSQWAQMGEYYKSSVARGVYVFPRGVRDTWDAHFNPESYPLYDRLIANMVAFFNVDPNRVYLTGYSAGGDGVYAIIARMSDRLAAANMSAGHPNGVPLWNIYSVPLLVQAGELDSAYGRNAATAEYSRVLDGYRLKVGGGYTHKCYIHAGKGHNFRDNSESLQRVFESSEKWLNKEKSEVIEVDTNAVRFVQRYVRNPTPKRVVWDLSQRAPLRGVDSFYWLRAAKEVSSGRIVVNFDRDSNSINVEECSVKGEIVFLISEDMLNVFDPVTVNLPEGRCVVEINLDFDLLFETTIERGDYNFQFVGKIKMTF